MQSASEPETLNLSRTSSLLFRRPNRCSLLSVLSDRYLKEKALSWAPKELSNQKNYIGCFIKALGDRPAADYAKADVVKFREDLLNSGKSPTTINKYSQKASLLFNWLANHQDGVINHFAGLKLKLEPKR